MGCVDSKYKWKPHGNWDCNKMGERKCISVEDVSGDGPFVVGKAPLPPALQGVFWLTWQGSGSCLASLGVNRDGGGLSTGDLSKQKTKDKKPIYPVRVSGDRNWAFADPDTDKEAETSEIVDLAYFFVFNDEKNPTEAQIYPRLLGEGGLMLDWEWLSSFTMALVADGPEKELYPNSVVWKRISTENGKPGGPGHDGVYFLIQIIDGEGNKIQDAFDKWVQFNYSAKAGSTPGKIFYHEIPEGKREKPKNDWWIMHTGVDP